MVDRTANGTLDLSCIGWNALERQIETPIGGPAGAGETLPIGRI
jgi:hypothetical protein